MSARRVSFIQSLLADPEKKKKLVVNTIIATQAREGIKTTREQAEAAYDKTKSKAEPVQQSGRSAAVVSSVAALPAEIMQLTGTVAAHIAAAH